MWSSGDDEKPRVIGNHFQRLVRQIVHRAFTFPSLDDADNCSACGNSSSGHHTALGYTDTFWSKRNRFPNFRCRKSKYFSRAGVSKCLVTNYHGPCIWWGVTLLRIGLFKIQRYCDSALQRFSAKQAYSIFHSSVMHRGGQLRVHDDCHCFRQFSSLANSG